MEAAVRAGRCSWAAGAQLPTASVATATLDGVGKESPTVAAQAWQLGQPEAACGTAQGLSWRESALCAYDRQLAEALENDPPQSSALATRATFATAGAEHRTAKQPSVDGRLQGVVSDPRRATGRASDG